MLRCGRCRVQPYCTKDCQKRDWPVHKLSCQATAAASASTQPPAPAATAASSSPCPTAIKIDDALLESMRERIRQDTADKGATHPHVLFDHSVLAAACLVRGRHAEAVAAGRAALEPVGVLRRADWDAFCHATFAFCEGSLALGRPGDALPRCRDFCAAVAAGGDRSLLPSELYDRLLLARCLIAHSMDHQEAGRRDEALQCLREVDGLYREDVASSPEKARRAWASLSTAHGVCLAAAGGHDHAALAVLARSEGACAPESEAGAAVHAALNLSSLGDHKEAQSAARRAVEAIERQPISSVAQAERVFDDAVALLSQCQPESAVTLFRRSLQYMVVQLGPSDSVVFNKHIDALEMLRGASRYADAHLLALRAALSVETHEAGKLADQNITFWRMKAVDCLTSLGRHEHALRERQMLLPAGFTEDDDWPLTAGWCFQKIGGSLALLGRHEEALTHDLYAIGLYRTQSEAIQVEFGTHSGWVHAAKCLLALGRPAQALPMLRHALKMQRKCGGVDPEVAATLQMLGDTLRTLSRLDEARKFYKEATAVMERVLESPPRQAAPPTLADMMAQFVVEDAIGARDSVEDSMQALGDLFKRLMVQKIASNAPSSCDRSHFPVVSVPAALSQGLLWRKK